MTNWEKDLNATYALTEWIKTIQSTYKHSHCTNHWDLALKLLHWSYRYLTPVRLSHIFKDAAILCWRDCGSKGTLFHLWECKSRRSFWNSIFSQLATITGNILPPKPTLTLLNFDNILIQRCIITHVLIAAYLTITSIWKTDKAPNVTDMINRVKNQQLYEKFFAYTSNSISRFSEKWLLWVARFPETPL